MTAKAIGRRGHRTQDGTLDWRKDPNLHNRILAGYLRDGALNVSGGTVSTPEIVVGLVNGNGALNLSSGSLTVENPGDNDH